MTEVKRLNNTNLDTKLELNCDNTCDRLNDVSDLNAEAKFFENFEKLKWLTSSEATVYLRIPSLNALRQLVYRRRIPFYKIGRKLLFNKAELDLFIRSNPMKRI